MGRPPVVRRLDVRLNGRLAGEYRYSPAGGVSFAYDADWLAWEFAFPISRQLPLREGPQSGAPVNAVFENLLPDNTDLRRRIACDQTLALLDRIVDASNPQEPVELHFAGDDLFAPLARRRGLPIGNLTSQFFANLYLDPLDHFCTEILRAPYLRYVDDFALFHDDPGVLTDWRARIAQFLERRRLKLHPRKTQVLPTSQPAEFLGYVLMPGGRRRLPDANIARFRGRWRSIQDRIAAGTLSAQDAHLRLTAREAHARFAQTRKLRNAVLGEKCGGARVLG